MANEAIDWSRYMEGLQGKANTDNTNLTGKADGVIDYQVNPDGSWYRQWKSGWLEQGGVYSQSLSNKNVPINLLKPYNDTNYNISIAGVVGDGNTGNPYCVREITTTKMTVGSNGSYPFGFRWKCEGQGGV